MKQKHFVNISCFTYNLLMSKDSKKYLKLPPELKLFYISPMNQKKNFVRIVSKQINTTL